MVRRRKLFPVVTLLLLLPLVPGASADASAADQPVASAVIPPPLADTPVVVSPNAASPTTPRPKRASTANAAAKPAGASKAKSSAASPAKPVSAADAEAWKRVLRSVAIPSTETAKRAVAQKPSRHAKRERHLQFARAGSLPHYPTRPRYYYPGAPVTGPDFDGPPSWYDRGMPPGYPRGPW